MKNAAIIIIGNEVLSGDVQDLNGNYLAKELAKIGICVNQLRIIADIEQEIINHINELRAKFDYLFVTGGIGPTHDDITMMSVAKAFGKKLYLDQKIANYIKNHYINSPQERIDAAMKMAYFPENCEFIYNPISQIPGFYLENTYIMAGVPSIMRAMFDNIRHKLIGGDVMQVKSIILELEESYIATKLAKLQEKFTNVEIGSYPFLNLELKSWHSNLVLKSRDQIALSNAYNQLQELIKNMS
jgi:molybdenum cofactor synthesis domain-containing protein